MNATPNVVSLTFEARKPTQPFFKITSSGCTLLNIFPPCSICNRVVEDWGFSNEKYQCKRRKLIQAICIKLKKKYTGNQVGNS